jgi:thiol-disulfide isomerase/thioredoxin
MVLLKLFYKHFLVILMFSSILFSQNESFVGREAPTFYLLDINNEDFFLSQEIDKPILINFFATWCGPCIEELSDLKDFDQKHGDKIKIILIDESNMSILPEQKTGKDGLIKFLKKENVEFDVLLDKYAIVAEKYNITETIYNKKDKKEYLIAKLPATFLLDKNGIILWEKREMFTQSDLDNLEQEFDEIFN